MTRARKDIAGRHQEDGAAAQAPPGAAPGTSSQPTTPLASTLSPAHPCLIQLVRLLARQTAEADIAAQRSAAVKGD